MLVNKNKFKNMIPQNDFQGRAKKYLKENEKLLKKYCLDTRPIISVPRNKISFILKIALWIIGEYKCVPDIQFLNTK